MAGVISPFGGGATASQLADLTGTVNVGSAAAPSAGLALLASSANTATWGAVGGAVSAVGSLIDATGTVTIGAATAPGAAGSMLVSSAAGTAVWTTTLGTALLATNAGTATIANALTDATGTVGVSAATAPGAAGSVLVSSSANTAVWTTTLGTALLATAAGTATIANALTVSGGTVNVSAAAAPATLQVLTAQSATTAAWAASMSLLESTGVTPYTLVNGTGNILTWTAPNDGALHRVTVIANQIITSTETGGAVAVSGLSSPNGASHSPGVFTGGGGVSLGQVTLTYFVEANTTFTLAQTSALTGGAAVLWAELWGS